MNQHHCPKCSARLNYVNKTENHLIARCCGVLYEIKKKLTEK